LPSSDGDVALTYASSNPEILDPETGEVHATGTKGEIVLLTVTATSGLHSYTRVFSITVDGPALTGFAIAGIVTGSTVFLAGLMVLILRKKIFKI